jgi:hypothetical protein
MLPSVKIQNGAQIQDGTLKRFYSLKLPNLVFFEYLLD